MSLGYLGSREPDLILYLPNPPLLIPELLIPELLMPEQIPEQIAKRMAALDQPLDIKQLIAINGNHWRKIFTILAKLSAPHSDWKSYRDHALLHRKEAICFDDRLIASSARHLVAGKASWMRLGLDADDFEPLDDRQRVWVRDNVFLTPYPDYRQFPNALIEQLKPLVGSPLSAPAWMDGTTHRDVGSAAVAGAFSCLATSL
ncbi:MAG: hypothetical protein ACI9W6_002589 [Motiliproteus sp.]|jgi:hypothetical protein